jgi:hypothetical protein
VVVTSTKKEGGGSELVQFGQELYELKLQTYAEAEKWSQRGSRTFEIGKSDSETQQVAGEHRLAPGAAGQAGKMLDAARAELIGEDNPTVKIQISSSVRDADVQFQKWDAGWHGYLQSYMKDKKIKSVADVDPAKLAYYIGQKLGAPGYSNHQSARAIDLMQWVADPNSQSGKTKIGKDGWEGSELHQWLIRNAEKYDFYPISGEPWHWEYKPQTN